MSDGITPLTPQQLQKYETKALHQPYWHRLLVALDMFVNVIFNGHPDETISSRSARAATEGKTWGVLMSKFLDLFQNDHGAKAEAADLERSKEVGYLEDKSGNL